MEGEENREKAIELYEKCVKYDPKIKMAYNNLALILSDMNRDDDAIDLYKKAMEIDPNYTKPLYNLG